jgi:hypothetical protein
MEDQYESIDFSCIYLVKVVLYNIPDVVFGWVVLSFNPDFALGTDEDG